MVVGFFAGLILTDHLPAREINIDPRISDPEQDAVQTQEEPAQDEETLGHDADLDSEEGDPIIGELVLVQDDLVEQKDGLRLLQSVEGDEIVRASEARGRGREFLGTVVSAGRRRPLRTGLLDWTGHHKYLGRRDSPLVRGGVRPIERLDDLLDVLVDALPHLLPAFGIRDLQHRLAGLVDEAQRFQGAKADPPARLVLDIDRIVAEDHLGRRDAKRPGHHVDLAALQDGKLVGCDRPPLDGDGLALVGSRVVGMRTGVVGHPEDLRFGWTGLVMESRGVLDRGR